MAKSNFKLPKSLRLEPEEELFDHAKAAEITPVVFLDESRATVVRKSRGKCLGWIPLYLGLVRRVAFVETNQPESKERKQARDVFHAPIHCWLSEKEALTQMAGKAKRGSQVLVLKTWVKVRNSSRLPDVVELWGSRVPMLKKFAWAVAVEDFGEVDWAGGEKVLKERGFSIPGPDELLARQPYDISQELEPGDLRGWAMTCVTPRQQLPQ